MKELAKVNYSPTVVTWGYPSKHFKVDVLFGTPGKDCLGAGICRLGYRGTFTVETNRCKAAMAEISMSNDQCLQFKFKRKDLCQKIQKIQFRHNCFRIQNDFWMPEFVNKALWLKPGYKIKKGRYSVVVSPLFFTVKFNTMY